MTDQTDNQNAPPKDGDQGGKRLLKVKPGRLDLKRTIDAGQVRQNFSHGRSKSVNVEVRRSRTFSPPAGGIDAKTDTVPPAGPAKPEPVDESALMGAAADAPARRPAVLRTLTEEEAEVRARALQGARDSGSASARLIDQVSKEAEARRNAERAGVAPPYFRCAHELQSLNVAPNDAARFRRLLDKEGESRATGERLQAESACSCKKVQNARAFDLKIKFALEQDIEQRFAHAIAGWAGGMTFREDKSRPLEPARDNSHGEMLMA